MGKILGAVLILVILALLIMAGGCGNFNEQIKQRHLAIERQALQQRAEEQQLEQQLEKQRQLKEQRAKEQKLEADVDGITVEQMGEGVFVLRRTKLQSDSISAFAIKIAKFRKEHPDLKIITMTEQADCRWQIFSMIIVTEPRE